MIVTESKSNNYGIIITIELSINNTSSSIIILPSSDIVDLRGGITLSGHVSTKTSCNHWKSPAPLYTS